MNLLEHGARLLGGNMLGQEIYRVEDELGVIIVRQRGDRRVLSFNSVLEQSYVSMLKPYLLMHEYTQAMMLGLIFGRPAHVTILGLGGGSLAHCLYYHFHRMQVQVVELRQAVIDVAYAYFELPKSPRVQVTKNDAAAFLNGVDAGFTDIIFSDLYGQEGMHPLQAQDDFIQQCHRALADDGWLVLNFHRMPQPHSAVMQAIGDLFVEVYMCDVPSGNKIIFCGKQSMMLSRSELNAQVKDLGKRLQHDLAYYFQRLSRIST